MNATATERARRDLWREGSILEGKSTRYAYYAKVYDTGSMYGIDEGRVSKLQIVRVAGSSKETVYNFDRGEDVSATESTQRLVDAVLALYPCEE